MSRHRRHSVEFKRQIVAEYLAGKSAHVLGRRHDLSRNLIRIWVEKAGAGQLDQEVVAADLLGAYEGASPRWSGWSASRRWRSSS